MQLPRIRQAEASDRPTLLNILTLAFAADPFNRWYLPDADRFLNYFPQMVETFLDQSIEAGACYLTSGNEGAALWLPPGVSPDEERMEALMAEAAPQPLLEPLAELFEAFESFHPTDNDCWYLPLIGVDPGHQGKGVGGVLMNHVTTLLDERGALGYLESSTPANISLYLRHGFEILEQLPFGDGGVVTPMIRPRSSGT